MDARLRRFSALLILAMLVAMAAPVAGAPEAAPVSASGATGQTLPPWTMPPPPPGVEIQKDLPYLAEGRQEKLDLYMPSNRVAGVRSPAVVIVHGGGWTTGDKARQREFITGTTLALLDKGVDVRVVVVTFFNTYLKRAK